MIPAIVRQGVSLEPNVLRNDVMILMMVVKFMMRMMMMMMIFHE